MSVRQHALVRERERARPWATERARTCASDTSCFVFCMISSDFFGREGGEGGRLFGRGGGGVGACSTCVAEDHWVFITL
jgi:hypothetical protein